MLKRLLRVAAVVPLVALALGATMPGAADAQGAIGSSPATAENFGTRSVTKVALAKAGESRWFVASNSGNTTRMGATLQTNPWRDDRGTTLLQSGSEGAPDAGRVAVFVNVRGVGDDVMGKKNEDAPGLTRVGFLTFTKNSGPDRVYHLMRPTDLGQFYYRLVNNSDMDVVYAFTMDHTFCLGCAGRDGGAENPKDWGLLPPPFAFAS